MADDMATGNRRRGKGEGTIYYDGSHDRYHAQITLENGKRKSIYGKTAAEVREKLTALSRDRDRGMVLPEGQQTVKQYLLGWLELMRPPRTRASTWIRYEQLVRVHLIPGLGKHKLAKLSAYQVEAFYTAKRKASGLSSTTVRRMHDVLHNALDDALRLDQVTRNVSELVDAPPEADAVRRHYTVEQVAVLLASLESHRLEALILVALATGMRQGEILALRWRDVDMACGTLQVRANRTRLERGYGDGPPKTRESAAKLALPSLAVEALRRQRVRVKEMRLRAGDRWQEHDLVFPTARGTHLLGPNLRKYWRAITEAAGLPYIRFHDLRHSAGTLLEESGVDIRMVSAALRHTRLDTTQRYSHVTDRMQAQTADAMERIMRRALALNDGHADEGASATGTDADIQNKD